MTKELTEDRAKDSVRFVFDALLRPEEALEREDVGPLHRALSSNLRAWIADGEHVGREVLWVMAVGSLNYDCVVPGSDLDMKAVYMPSARDFYRGRFPRYSFVTDEFDCEIHPAHDFIEHMLKGNINFFEPLYSRAALAEPDFIHLMKTHIAPLVGMNIVKTALASYWTAMNQHVGTKYESTPGDGFNSKHASHAIRLLVFVIELLETGRINIVPRNEFKPIITGLKKGQVPWTLYSGVYTELEETARGLLFEDANSKGSVLQKVQDMDGRGSEKWQRHKMAIEDEMVRRIGDYFVRGAREQIRQAALAYGGTIGCP